MKKIILTFFLSFAIGVNAQLVDSGLNAVTSDEVTNQIKPNSCKGDKATDSWWACGYMELENGVAKFVTDKGPQLRQKIALSANTTYTISFDAWMVDDAELDTKHLYVTFQEDPGSGIHLNTILFEKGLTTVDVGYVSKSHKWTYKVENTSSQSFTINFTPEQTNEYIFSIGRGSDADLTYVDNIYMSSATATDGNNLVKVINVFPNPANAMVHVEATSNIHALRLINTLGVTVKYISIQSNSVALDVSDLPGGLYVLNVQSENSNHTQTILVE